MLKKLSNPYDVLSETISFENVQQIGELITLKTLRGRYAYARQTLEWLYVGFVKDLNRNNDSQHVFSDAYDLAQTAICFLCEFIGKSLNDVYMIKNGQEISIKKAAYLLVGRTIDRMRRYMARSRDINDYTEELSVEIDHYEEKDYTEVDNKIELLNLKPRDRAVLDCYMAGMTCNEIAEYLDIDRITVWRRRTRAQVKYKALFF
jgi:DNA-directed RNA polymerase specialized sigma subunit